MQMSFRGTRPKGLLLRLMMMLRFMMMMMRRRRNEGDDKDDDDDGADIDGEGDDPQVVHPAQNN